MQAWETFLDGLEKTLGKASVEHWLRPLKVIQYDACNLYLEAENEFQISWFQEQIPPQLLKEFKNNNGHLIKIHFKRPEKKEKSKTSSPLPPLPIKSEPLDPSQTFANFVVGKENQLVTQFFKEITPGAFNPLFLYGAPGVGKTHLLMATAHLLQDRGLSVFCVHAETFTEHVVRAIRNSQMGDFRKTYRNQDILIIDDIDQIARKAATQEELFHTFNALHTAGKQIILCSHLAPQQIEDVEPRLISRFEWGIVLQLQELEKEQRIQLLITRANAHNFPLSEEIIAFLLQTFSSSSKYLMRALEALMLRHSGTVAPSLPSVQLLLADLIDEEKKNQLTPEKILTTVSNYFGIRKEDILGVSQSKECVLPRKIAMYFCRKKLSLSYLTIARIFDRDHSTVMSSIKQIDEKNDQILEIAKQFH